MHRIFLHGIINFNPLPPWGGRPHTNPAVTVQRDDFNPLPPWGGRLVAELDAVCFLQISIHSLRGEGDGADVYQIITNNISIHSLRGEGDRLTCSFTTS